MDSSFDGLQIRYVLFDLADTLIHKPRLFPAIQDAISRFGFSVPLEVVRRRHKELTERTCFPPKTNEDVYRTFNRQLLVDLRLPPSEELCDLIYRSCRHLKWERFDDLEILKSLQVPMGLLSNWDTSLEFHVRSHLGCQFSPIIGSGSSGLSKPNPDFYKYALAKLGLPPSHVLMVGDSLTLDIQPANSIGMRAVLIDRHNLMTHYGGLKITSMSQIGDYLQIHNQS